MTEYKVTCERMRDNKRFTKTFKACSELEAVCIANRALFKEVDDYYVISAVQS